jgi:hypothetical protein
VAQARVCKTLDAGSIPAAASNSCSGSGVVPLALCRFANDLQTPQLMRATVARMTAMSKTVKSFTAQRGFTVFGS